MIIGFCGKAGAGKSEITQYLCHKYFTHPASFADPLRLLLMPVLALVFRGDEDKVNYYLQQGKDKEIGVFRCTVRTLMCDFGTSMRQHNENVFVDLMRKKISMIQEVYRERMASEDITVPIIIDDVRYDNEAAMIKQQGGTIIKIERREEDLRKVPAHSSENGIDVSYIDLSVTNDGSLLSLHSLADSLATFYELEGARPVFLKETNYDSQLVH